ncbi:MaoC like domain-containing protein [Corynebacterium mycetoides]|uniref:MaoC like domain-containing protein n=1 Tax=Corynebacterium mycetoides TaxID=38302 RepID=A0A1G9NCI6_9CORY|nr:MaoC/PaaZ C-terminal domain-containing protein [Corynebacterium mycetoides]SDL84266.1 MaoC like domain-containing protein [Corynebacterium mycetoides]
MSEYTVLNKVPDLDKVMNQIKVGMLPVVGTTHVADADPTSRTEVRGVTVDVDKLAAYTSATGLRLGNELPPTYFFVVAFPIVMDLMARKDFPFAPTGAVHIANEISQKRPLRVDETYTVRARGERLRPHRKGLLIDMVTEVFAEGDESGEPVWTQVSTFLGQGQKFAKSAPVALTTRGVDDGRRLGTPELPDVAANGHFKVTGETVSNYVDASGDKNPIHTSTLGAKVFGFPGIIAHGMYSAAAALRFLEGKLGGALTYRVEFYKPVVVPTRVAEWVVPEGDNAVNLQLRSTSKPDKVHLNARVEYL